MSKPRPPARPDKAQTQPQAQAQTPAAPITADSSGLDICRETIRLRMEILRRQSYQEFLEVQAQLAKMPPLTREGAPHDDGLPET